MLSVFQADYAVQTQRSEQLFPSKDSDESEAEPGGTFTTFVVENIMNVKCKGKGNVSQSMEP